MLSLRRTLPAARARAEALRQLYRQFRVENKSDARGLRLLRHWLSVEQRAQFDASGYFEVVGSDSGMRYRIYYGPATNVYQMNHAGHLHTGWCFGPLGELVPGDVMLAQKIALETNERSALMVANKFQPRRGLRRANERWF
jgi:hypothetical protein